VKARYIKMLGIKRATGFGYSLYALEVYGRKRSSLSDVHFIRLLLKDEQDRLLSENVYWRSNKLSDYRALNNLPEATLSCKSRLLNRDGKGIIEATVSNPSSAVAFAVRVSAVRTSDGERILPAIMNDNYFTLFKGESKVLMIEFDPALLQGGGYKLIVEPYNKKHL
jgi:hypothetical protein